MELAKISDQNPWWKFGREFEYHDPDLLRYNRSHLQLSRRYLQPNLGNVTVLVGPRQVGKTCVMKIAIRELLRKNVNPRTVFFMNCEALTGRTRAELRKALDHFFILTQDAAQRYIFLDEITTVEDWQITLKELIDSGKLANASTVVTGSYVPGLGRFTELFPGRSISQVRMYPISFRGFVSDMANKLQHVSPPTLSVQPIVNAAAELTKASGSPDDLPALQAAIRSLIPFESEFEFLWQMYLTTGGVPPAVSDYVGKRFVTRGNEAGLASIEQRIFEDYAKVAVDDIIRLGRNERILRQILKAITKTTGQRASLHTLSKHTEEGVRYDTVGEYLDLLEHSMVLNVLQSCDLKARSPRPKANRKAYLIDPFIHYSVIAWLEGRDGPSVIRDILERDEPLSNLVELITAQHLAIAGLVPFMRELPTFLWLFYDRDRELDFVYHAASGDLVGVEVKYQSTAVRSNLPRLDELTHTFVLTKGTTDLTSDRVTVVPAPVFLAALKTSEHCL